MTRILEPSGDDWVAKLRCRRRGVEFTPPLVGISGSASEAEAIRLAKVHVSPPRATAEGRGCEILDVQICRMWELRARQIAAHAEGQVVREIEHWQKGVALV